MKKLLILVVVLTSCGSVKHDITYPKEATKTYKKNVRNQYGKMLAHYAFVGFGVFVVVTSQRGD